MSIVFTITKDKQTSKLPKTKILLWLNMPKATYLFLPLSEPTLPPVISISMNGNFVYSVAPSRNLGAILDTPPDLPPP